MGNAGSKVGLTVIASFITGVAGYKGLKSVKFTQELVKENLTNHSINKLGLIVGAAFLAGFVYLIFKDESRNEAQPLKFQKMIKLSNSELYQIESISTDSFKELKELYKCPISHEIMKKPVSLVCGHEFQQKFIREQIEKRHCCPLCKHKAQLEHIRRALKTEQSIEQYRKMAYKKGQQFLRRRIEENFDQELQLDFS